MTLRVDCQSCGSVMRRTLVRMDSLPRQVIAVTYTCVHCQTTVTITADITNE